MSVNQSVQNSLLSLSQEAKELYLPSNVPRLSSPPTPLVFLRNYILPNLPVIIENGVSNWPALKKWTNQYLKDILGDKRVTVSLTPNGYADAPVGDRFVLPHEEQMKFKHFFEMMENSAGAVAYIQKQNSSFLEEFSELLPDAATDISWASEAFGKSPDAVNFWMGSERSVTSMHKDHYENLYAVVRGSKSFILHPPTDLPCIPYKRYKLSRYKKDQNGRYLITDEKNTDQCTECSCGGEDDSRQMSNLGLLHQTTKSHDMGIESLDLHRTAQDNTSTEADESYNLKTSFTDRNGISSQIDLSDTHAQCGTHSDELRTLNELEFEPPNPSYNNLDPDTVDCVCACHQPTTVPWIDIDPLIPDVKKYPKYKHSNAITVMVHPGDILYLPSLWFHHVRQSNETIAVNFWYDMEYDIKYNYFRFVENLIENSS